MRGWLVVPTVMALCACGRIGFGTVDPDACIPGEVGCVPPSNVALADVQLGGRHGCALDVDGNIVCWGDNFQSQLGVTDRAFSDRMTIVGGGFSTLAVGGAHTCGLRDGVAWCWGENASGQATGTPGAQIATPTEVAFAVQPPRFETLEAGGGHTCALGAGELWCWGHPDLTEHAMPSAQRVGQLADWTHLGTGRDQTCAISDSLGLVCWGINIHGQAGMPASPTRALAPITGLPTDVRTLAVGTEATCALLVDGSAWCWGFNLFGQIDPGNRVDQVAPVRIGTDNDWTSIAITSRYACGVRAGRSYCWGWSVEGALGDGMWDRDVTYDSANSIGTADAIAVTVAAYDLGPSYAVTCARSGTSVSCWGSNSVGQLGNGVHTLEPAAVALPSQHVWRHIDAGEQHFCAIATDDTLACWGSNERGQVLGGSAAGESAPCTDPACSVTRPTETAMPFADEVVVGRWHTCARRGGNVSCWGDNQFAQLGGSVGVATQRVDLAAPSGAWTRIIGDEHATCGMTTTSATLCWGHIASGFIAPPAAIAGAEVHDLEGIGCSTFCSAIRTDGARLNWGQNNVGQIGDGTTTPKASPAAFEVGGYTSVAVSGTRTCALTQAGTVACWGGSVYGECGVRQDSVLSPQIVADADGPLTACTDVSVSSLTSCAICGGQPYCWGNNQRSELGNPNAESIQSTAVPVTVPAGHTFVEIAMAVSVGCALDTEGTLYCWGSGDRGELGNGSHSATLPVTLQP